MRLDLPGPWVPGAGADVTHREGVRACRLTILDTSNWGFRPFISFQKCVHKNLVKCIGIYSIAYRYILYTIYIVK